MNNELDSLDSYLRSEIEELELTPSEHTWSAVEQKMSRNASVKKENTIRKLRISLSVVVPAFCLFVAYHYYNKTTPNTVDATKTQAAVKNATQVLQTEVEPVTENKSQENSLADSHVSGSTEVKNNSQATIVNTTNRDAQTQNAASEEELILATRPVTSLKEKNVSKSATTDKITVLKYVLPTETHATSQTNASEENAVSERTQDPSVTTASEINEKALFVPSAFTPNGDGLNDVFLPTASEEPKEYKLSIFDRSGALVFQTDNFKTGWDGRTFRGGADAIREDVYMWRIEMKNSNGEKEHLMGSLTLLK